MPDQRRRSMGIRASQLLQDGSTDAMSVGSPRPTRSRSAERSSLAGSSSSSSNNFDCCGGISHTNSNHSDPGRNNSVDISVGSGHFQRSNSDPFDDGGDELVPVQEVHVSGPAELANHADKQEEDEKIHKVKALPTLHRFPCTQTRNQNCWSESPTEMFAVRGPKYMSGDKTKIPCKHYLLRSRGCDLFLTNDNSKSSNSILQGGLGGNLRKKPTVLFRFLFPWGMLIQYYEVPPKLVPFMKMGMNNDEKQQLSIEGFTNAEKALARWLASDDTEFKNDRLKLIAIVPEGPWIVRNLVTGKPALIGKRLQVSYKYVPRQNQSSMECLQICDLDISSGTTIAKKAVSVTRRYLSSLTAVDVGFVIEGKTPGELPEEMMGSTRLHQVDPSQAPSV